MFLKYNKNEKLEFNYKRACGLWLILVAAAILAATFAGGKQIINMQIFCIGYIVSFFTVNMNKRVLNKLSDGSLSEFQRKVSLYAIILLLVLMSLLGGPFFADENWRLIWLGALMATAIHFFMYYFVHGKSMIYLGAVCTLNILAGYIFSGVPVTVIAYIDAAIKLIFGIYLLFSQSRQNRNNFYCIEVSKLRYILLLRGINVGGKNKVAMSELKVLLTEFGFEDVDSYINSGNLFFNSGEIYESCISKIKHLLEMNFDFSIPFTLISKEEYLKEKESLPKWWHQEMARRDVLFFSYDLDRSKILDFIDKSTFYNEIVYVGKNAVFWGKYDDSEYLKTTYHKKLIKQDFYKHITIRNGNTFEKIAEILENGK